MSAPEEIQEMVDLIEPHADELDDRAVNKIFDAARRLRNAGFRRDRGDEPAFPLPGGAGDFTVQKTHLGMTLRDYFAAKALVAIMATEWSVEAVTQAGHSMDIGMRQAVAETAYSFADEMLKARQK